MECVDIITIARFVSKVLAMRSAQRRYFRDRNFPDLAASKALEKEVDDLMESAVKASSKLSAKIN